MKQEIIELRSQMSAEGMDVYYVPAGDPHGSEYVNDHYKACEFLSGLLAENETLIVTDDGAWIWTDGRFFLQADRELAGSGIELMKMGVDGVPTPMEFMVDLAKKYFETHKGEFAIGFDGRTVPAGLDAELKKAFSEAGLEGVVWKFDKDLAGRIWKDRPAIRPSDIWQLPLSSAGMTAADKVSLVREKMAERGADVLVLADLTSTAWLFNLRGADIDYTPVFFSFAVITQDQAILYVMDGTLDDLRKKGFDEDLSFVEFRNYDQIYDDVSGYGSDRKVWMDLKSANYDLLMAVRGVDSDTDNVINETDPVTLAKTVKNETEIHSTINAHIKDGVAVTKFIRWIKEAAKTSRQTEISAADHLEALRREQQDCFDLSFGSISGYGPNGAIVHYAPSPETDLEIKPEGFLLMDSGGQYLDGTTDITRTIAVGPLTQEMKEGYTRVLKGHIALSRYVITPETTYKQLDECTRASLREVGLDYMHGVSHGVGHVLAVHEGPAGVKKTDTPHELKPGMIMSNEPGLYIAGEYGIRIENEILMKDGGSDTLISEPITMVPYEREAIVTDLLTDEELEWINNYHSSVREVLMPFMDGADRDFLIKETEPIIR
ncbi:MAG: aminopeptidase P family protein [Mogibacterium sp.]|nr:aminopeptidase P family protein [Mogibacterium sp.]